VTTDIASDNTELKAQLLEAGHAAFDNEDFTAALEQYHRACLLDPNDAAVWTALGLTFSNLEFPREAWRSYLLALHFEPENRNALWYSAEFLASMGDLDLALMLLERYMGLEDDPERRTEAQELQTQLKQEAQDHGLNLDAGRRAAASDLLQGGSQAATGELLVHESEAETEGEAAPADIALSDEELEALALSGQTFIPPLTLTLSGFEAVCPHCSLHIPRDAPFCWSCRMIHFYD
jgi:tetratricopeptide (TPR) repeat protein